MPKNRPHHQEDALNNSGLKTSVSEFLEIVPLDLRPRMWWLAILTTLGTVAEVLGIGMVIPFLSLLVIEDFPPQFSFIASAVTSLGVGDPTHLILLATVAFVVVFLLKSVLMSYIAFVQAQFHYQLQERLSSLLFRDYLLREFSFHMTKNSAEFKRNIIVETNTLTTLVSIPIITAVAELLTVTGLAILLFVLNPLAAAAAIFIPICVGIPFYAYSKERLRDWGNRRQSYEGQRIKLVDQGFGGIKTIKVFGNEQELLVRFDNQNKHFVNTKRNHYFLSQLPRVLLEVIAIVVLAVIVFLLLLADYSSTELIPIAGVFAMVALRLMPSANRILGSLQNIRFGAATVSAIKQHLKSMEIREPEPVGAECLNLQTEISVQSLRFRHETSDRILFEDIELTIPAFGITGFIGESGSGKTTLVDIIIGLLKPSAGSVIVDGQDIEHNLQAWQRQIGYVPQQVFLTDDTLRNNIAYFVPEDEISESAIAKAVHSAQLDDLVRQLPDGLDTLVGENGVRLSGGQRQRIGIARALYRNPSVIVLDEATSALDSKTEAAVMECIQSMRSEKTILIVSHRMSFIQYCNQVFEIVDGTVKKH